MRSTSATPQPKHLPLGWKWTKLGDICEVVGGSTPDTSEPTYWNGEILWVTPTDLGRLETETITESDRYITSAGLKSCSTQMLPVGTVIMSSRAPIGHLAMAGKELCTNQGCKSFVPNPGVDSYFLYWSLMHSMTSIQRLGSGATFAEVSKTSLQNFEISLPSLREQKRIVAVLNDQLVAAQALRTAAEERLEAARELRQAFSKAVFESTAALTWTERAIGDVSSFLAKQVDPKLHEYRNLPYVNGENIEAGTGRILYLKSSAELGMSSGKYLFNKGDVLYSKLRPYLRKAATVNFEGLCSADMYPLTPKTAEITPDFLCLVLLSPEFTQYANDESKRTRMPKLNRNQLMAWKHRIPPVDKQRSIIDLLSRQKQFADDIEKICEATMSEVKALPTHLISRAFSGEM